MFREFSKNDMFLQIFLSIYLKEFTLSFQTFTKRSSYLTAFGFATISDN